LDIDVTFALVGLSHRTAPLEVRERAFIAEAAVGECVRRLVDRDLVDAGVLLSTCNRTELYAVSDSPAAAAGLFEAFALWPHELPFQLWRQYAYQLSGRAALDHLFRVGCGLDSMVLGEGQVLGQLKRAFVQAQQAGVVDASLQVILRGAIRAGKRVRDETALGRNPVSVSHAAVAQARALLGSLAGREVLLVGAGEMTEVALRLLHKQGIGRCLLASRTRERAARVAGSLGAEAIDLAAVDDLIDGVDLVLCSSSAPHHVLDADDVQRLQARRRERPLVIVDMAVPRDVDPRAGEIPGVHLLNLDDLQTLASENIEGRRAFIPAAERIVAEELDRVLNALDARASAPVIRDLVDRVERLRDRELERHLAELPADDERGRAALRALARGLTAKTLHQLIGQLHREAGADG
jgi:glutamyl-tRNA reductase